MTRIEMTDSEFLGLIDQILSQIEDAFEAAGQGSEVDVECSRSGSLLEIEFLDNHSKVIINSQMAIRELWVAAKSGGYHYQYDGQRWLNTRDQSELMAKLAEIALAQGQLVL
jgi:CyaY protein